MTATASDLPAQEAAPFSLTMEVEEDIEQEIESFVRFKRRGEYEQAEEVFQETLSRHLSLFPVIAEYADFLLVQDKYRILSEFLDIQMQYMESVFEEEEMELMRIMKSFVTIHTKGLLRSALVQAKRTWDFLARRSASMPPDTLPGDVEIHVFEIYIKIIIFALGTSNWVGPDEMKCPWAPEQDSDHSGFVLWYLVLSSNGHLWSASQVLLSLLEALPSLQEYDAVALFDNHCFGDMTSEESLDDLNEMDQLIACSVSFSRAQALLNLALLLYRRNSHHIQWKEVYELGYRYNRIANCLPTIMQDHDVHNIVDLRAYVQRTQFERVKAELITPKLLPQLPRVTMAFQLFTEALLQQDPRYYYICYFQSVYDCACRLTNVVPPAPLSLIDLQLHDQGNQIGFLRTCDLFSTLMTNLLRGRERGYFPSCLSPEADSFLALEPFSSIQKTPRFTEAIADLVIQLSSQVIRFQMATLGLKFEKSVDVGSFSEDKSAIFDIPSYLRVVPYIQERFESILWESSNLTAPPRTSYLQEIEERSFVRRVHRGNLSLIARLVLAESQNQVWARKKANHRQDKKTSQARESELDPTPTQARLEPDSSEPVEVHNETIVQRHKYEPPGLLHDKEPAKKTFADQRVPFVSLPTGESPVQFQAEAVKEPRLPTHDELSSSYASICNDLRAGLMEVLELCDDHDRRFAKRGTAQEVLRGDKLVQFLQCLQLQESNAQYRFPPLRIIASVLAEKHLEDFLAILIFAMCDIEAAQKFVTKVLFSESRSAELSVPTSREILEELFEDKTATDQFLAQQAIFCPVVIRKGREVVIPSLDYQRFPYLEEDLITQASSVKVFKVKIAEGHFFDSNRDSANRSPRVVVRKDYTMSGILGIWLSSVDHDVMKSILSLKKDCKNVAESYGSLAIGSSTYSLFMPLAKFNLEQYMMNRYQGPLAFSERINFIQNTLGLTKGLCYLHTELKSETGTSFICYDFGLKPEKVLLFEEYDKDGGKYRWKLSDFGMAHVKYREHRQAQYTTVRNFIHQRYGRPLQSRWQDSLLPLLPSNAEQYEGTYLPPESMDTLPNMDTRSDVWSLGCIISVVFTFMEKGQHGLFKYAAHRENHKKAEGFDRFFLCDKGRSRPKTLHPAVKNWHRRLIAHAKARRRNEGKAVEFILKFLESAVFTERAKRCDAQTVKQKLLDTWGKYDGDESRYERGIARVDRFLQLPQTMIRRIVTHGEEHKDQEEQEEPAGNESDELSLPPLRQLIELYPTLGELDEMRTFPDELHPSREVEGTTPWSFRDTS